MYVWTLKLNSSVTSWCFRPARGCQYMFSGRPVFTAGGMRPTALSGCKVSKIIPLVPQQHFIPFYSWSQPLVSPSVCLFLTPLTRFHPSLLYRHRSSHTTEGVKQGCRVTDLRQATELFLHSGIETDWYWCDGIFLVFITFLYSYIYIKKNSIWLLL